MSRFMPVIYIDILIALNMFIDFALISACSYILRLPRGRLRIPAGAAIGGISSCIVLIPDIPPVLYLFLNAVVAAVIVRVAFKFIGIKAFLKQLAVFLVVSAIFAGIAFAVWLFITPSGFSVINGVIYCDISPLMLTALTVLSYVIICIYDRITHKKGAPHGSRWRLMIDCGNGTAALNALYDTGHHVTDIFTGSPVAIVSRNAISPYLPTDMAALLDNTLTDNALSDCYSTAVKAGLRIIPCRTVAGTALLPSFRPNSAVISSETGGFADISGILVAVTDNIGRGEYLAIIGNDIVCQVPNNNQPAPTLLKRR